MARELELKLIADAGFEEVGLLRHLGAHAQVGEASERVQRDVYLDTPRGELAAAGLSGRLRQAADIRTIEVKPVPIDPALIRDRPELQAHVDEQQEPADVLRQLLVERLGLQLRGDPVIQVGLQTRRRRFDVHAERFDAELCVDEVQVDGGGSFVEVELELSEGDSAAFRSVAETLTAVAGLQPSRHSKVERARQSVGLPPFEYGVQLPAFEQDTTIGTVARGVGSALFRTMLAYGPGTRVGLDPEHLHKMRVSTRRLRTALRVFRRAFDRDDRKALQAELRWLGGILGEVRDLDVHLLALPQWIARFGPDPAEGWASLEDALTRHHTEARARLLQALDDPRYAALARRADALFGGDDPTDEAKQPAGKAGRRILAARVDRFREAVERFRRTHAAEDAHRLRIVGKRLRYTARFLQPLLDDRTQQGLRSLAAFQDRLGAIQDVVAAGDLAHRLRDEAMTADQPDAAYLYVLGQLGGAAAMSVALIRPVVDRALDDLEAEISLEQLGA